MLQKKNIKQLKDIIKYDYYSNINYIFIKNIIGKFIKKGNKLRSLKIYTNLKIIIKKKSKKEANFIMLIAIVNNLFKIDFIKKRFGGTRKEIPIYMGIERQVKKVVKLIFKYIYLNKKLNLNRFLILIGACFKKKGPLLRNKQELFKKALLNKIFIRYIRR